MNKWNMKKRRRLLFLISAIYHSISVCAALDINVVSEMFPFIKTVEKIGNVKRELINASAVAPSNSTTNDSASIHKPLVVDDSLIIPQVDSYKLKADAAHARKEERSKAHFAQTWGAKKRESEAIRPSILGSMFLYLITVVVAGTLFVILVCFAHKWRENMGVNVDYPKVEYSMLRQGEDEPEDPMGEILINIGLAAPEDIRPLSETESEVESDNPQSTSFEPSPHRVPPFQPQKSSKFTTISLQSDEASHLLSPSHHDESDEELLQ